MHKLYKKPLRIIKGNNSNRIGLYIALAFYLKSICLADMNMFAWFDEIQDIEETNCFITQPSLYVVIVYLLLFNESLNY